MKWDGIRNSQQPFSLSRRALGAAAIGLVSTKSFADSNNAVEATIVPRVPRKPSKPFVFRINGPAERVGISTERLKRIGAYLQGKVDNGVIAGAVTAVARRGELVHHQTHGYFNIETKDPMRSDAIFRMFSSTKPVTGVVLLMMLEEGKIRLQDPISKYIPDFRDMKVAVLKPGQPERRVPGAPPRQIELVPANRQITLLDLATHTSGLVSNGPGTENSNVVRSPTDTLASFVPRLATVPLDFQPGTKWAYSGQAGPDTLGRIIEIVSGKDVDTLYRERVFGPLEMDDTHFNVPPAKASRVLPVTRRVNDAWEVKPAAPVLPPTPYFQTSGGLWSTCHDYLMFEQMLLNKGELNGQRLLGSRTVELMGTNQIGDLYWRARPEEGGHGFGILVRIVLDSSKSSTGRSNGAFGWDGALGTMSWNDPAEEISAVIMLQQRDTETMWGYEREVRQAIID